MLVLFESSVGYALFRMSDTGKLGDAELHKQFDTPAEASNLLKLQSIHRFASTAAAVEDMTAIADGKLSKSLKAFLVDEVQGKGKGAAGSASASAAETLVVSDPKLGGAIAKKLAVNVVSDSTTLDLFRGIRTQLAALLADEVDEADVGTMSLGLSHSLSRFKLKFSPDKVDVMIVQAIALLDDLDKEVNIYAMRVKEWYGWHFPEMGKIIADNIAYAKCIRAMGMRENAATTDFASILPEELEETLKAAAVVSMGTEISDSDLAHIQLLVDQVISITAYRAELSEYLRNRMAAIAPNLTALLGELVGARLIAHSGSLLNLAKQPASTIQILGAEKALFRALKTKHDTPKYGLIFHASLVGSAPQPLKGKMARMTAGKAALSIRLDALADADSKSSLDAPTIGLEARVKLESRLRSLEAGLGITSVKRHQTAGAGVGGPGAGRRFEMQPARNGYNTAADTLIPSQPAPVAGPSSSVAPMAVDGEDDEKAAKRARKEAKRAAKAAAAAQPEAAPSTDVGDDAAAKAERKRLKKLAKAQAAATTNGDADTSAAAPPSANGKPKKRKSMAAAEGDATAPAASEEPKRKKSRKSDAPVA